MSDKDVQRKSRRASSPKRQRTYGRPQARGTGRHYIVVCMRTDVYEQVQRLVAAHDLSLSGAAHHLMRLGAGLEPLEIN
jgi:hypothetical protein